MILLTGGSGVLGKELIRLIDWCPVFAPPRQKLDVGQERTGFAQKDEFGNPELIVHLAAYTDVLKAETEKELCYQTNVIGTRNLAGLGIPMLYISTEYVFDGQKGNYSEEDYPNPQNFYALTKLLGEYESRRSPRSVVVRCLFKPRPFEHPAGCIDQFTTGDYVDVIAKEVALAVKLFNNLPLTLHIGTGKKSTYELARASKPDVRKITLADIPVRLPKDTSLNTSKWETIKSEHRLCKN